MTTTAKPHNLQQLSLGLGWFSIGLGLSELLMPGPLARLIGINDTAGNRGLLRFYGARELAAGFGILTQPQNSTWLWSRVAGDTVDLASLAKAYANDDNNKGLLTTATAAVLGVTALDIYCARELSRNPLQQGS